MQKRECKQPTKVPITCSYLIYYLEKQLEHVNHFIDKYVLRHFHTKRKKNCKNGKRHKAKID